ncbi:glycosyltransferase family 1 protein [Candidatus Parcubacteria bacterium]|nr:MAG: glycosyltransferase family 1 protein [Candidatus Parcubacteria bacterium]
MKLEITGKIVFLITESDWGGAQRFLIEFLPRFVKSYPEIEIVVAAGGKGYIMGELQKNGIRFVNIPNLTSSHFSPLKDIGAFLKIIKLLKSECPDIFFLLSTKAGFYGSLASIIHKIIGGKKLKVFYRIGGFAFTEDLSRLRKLVYLWIEKSTSWLKDIIIVNSQNNFDLAIDKKITNPDKLRLVRNGIDLKTFQKILYERDEARNKLGLKTKGKTVIGTIANFYRNKGLDNLVNSAFYLLERNPALRENLLFVIIGDGPEKKLIEGKINVRDLNNLFELKGAIPNAASYLKAFDVFVLPSLKEGSPWTIIEAMAAKLPIIATAVGGIPEIIEDKKNGLLIEPADNEALEQAMLSLLSDKNYRQVLAQEAYNKTSQFSIELMVQQFSELIIEALE